MATRDTAPRSIRNSKGLRKTRDVRTTLEGAVKHTSARRFWPFFALYAIALSFFGVRQSDFFALSNDYTWVYQNYVLFGRGILIPEISACKNLLCSHFDILIYPLSLFAYVTKATSSMKVIQAVAAAGAQFVGFLWASDIIRDSPNTFSSPRNRRLLWVVLFLALVNPWVVEACGFDYHDWAVAGFWLALSGWSFYNNRRSAGWIFALLTSLTGDLACTYVAALALTLIIFDRRFRGDGSLLFILQVAWLYVIVHVFNMGQPHSTVFSGQTGDTYGYLGDDAKRGATGVILAIIKHPVQVFHAIADARENLYANVSPLGFVFLLYPMTAIIWGLALFENLLTVGASQSQMGAPGFQYAGVYALALPGTAWFFTRRLVSQQRRPIYTFLIAALLINMTAWAVTWIPHAGWKWIRVSSNVATHLRAVLRDSKNEDVIVSNGIAGAFSGRADFSLFPDLTGFDNFRLKHDSLEFILSGTEGIEIVAPDVTNDLIARLLESKQTQVDDATNGLWVFRYQRVSGQTRAHLVATQKSLPAVIFSTDIGSRTITHNVADSYLGVKSTNAHGGYLMHTALWRRPAGVYTCTVDFSASRAIRFEIWNMTSGRLIKMQDAEGPRRTLKLSFTVDATADQYAGVYRGWGPFRESPTPRLTGENIEVRVFARSGTAAKLYSVDLQEGVER